MRTIFIRGSHNPLGISSGTYAPYAPRLDMPLCHSISLLFFSLNLFLEGENKGEMSKTKGDTFLFIPLALKTSADLMFKEGLSFLHPALPITWNWVDQNLLQWSLVQSYYFNIFFHFFKSHCAFPLHRKISLYFYVYCVCQIELRLIDNVAQINRLLAKD